MDRNRQAAPPSAARLIVADWTIDPRTVVATCDERDPDRLAALHVVVPAWLHGLDWAGDPRASVPCARRQLEQIAQRCAATGLRAESLSVGDPDPLSSIADALAAHPVGEILVFGRGRHVAPGYPLSLVRRAERVTGLPVHGIAVRSAPRRSRRLLLPGGHCEPGHPRLA